MDGWIGAMGIGWMSKMDGRLKGRRVHVRDSVWLDR